MSQPLGAVSSLSQTQIRIEAPEKKMCRCSCGLLFNIFRKKIPEVATVEAPQLESRVVHSKQIDQESKAREIGSVEDVFLDDIEDRKERETRSREVTTPTVFPKRKRVPLQATVGDVTFRLGKSPKDDDLTRAVKPGTLVVEYDKVVVRDCELKSIQFVTAVADALYRAGVNTKSYKNQAEFSRDVEQVITRVAHTALQIPLYTPLRSSSRGRFVLSEPLVKSPSSGLSARPQRSGTPSRKLYFV